MPEITNNDQKVEELYSDMLKTADDISANGITEESVENLETIKSETEQLTSKDATEETPVVEGEKVMQKYDPETGEQTIDDNSTKEIIDKITNQHFNNLVAADEGISTSVFKDVFKDLSKNLGESDQDILVGILTRRMVGEKFNVYDAMTDTLKQQIDSLYMSVASKAPKGSITKNQIATECIDELINDFKKSTQSQVDLDTVLSGFDDELKKMTDDLSSELGGMMMSFDDERKAEIDAAIKRCEEEGNEAGIAKLTEMRDTVDEAFHLTKFIEFCKNCKVKNIEAKEPEKRVFDYFNSKYVKHKYSINDIRSCPIILDRHLIDYNHQQNTLICIAFCKYCQDMSPDNMGEHTFMYYFIRNIIAIDKLNPKGLTYDSMDERSKNFYDTFVNALKQAMANLLERNPKFKDE